MLWYFYVYDYTSNFASYSSFKNVGGAGSDKAFALDIKSGTDKCVFTVQGPVTIQSIDFVTNTL